MKPDSSAFSTLKSNAVFKQWFDEITVQLRGQGLENLHPDIQYIPRTADEATDFRSQQNWFFSVLTKVVQTPTGKAILRDYLASGDARGVLQELRDDATVSTAGILFTRQLRQQILTISLDGTWKSTQMSFLLRFEKLVDEYNALCANRAARINDWQAKEYLETAVEPAPNLRDITTREVEHVVNQRGPPYTYRQYLLLLTTAAQLHDEHRPRVPRRAHQSIVEPVGDDPPDEDVPADPPDVSRSAHVATKETRPRLPNDTYRKLSSTGRSTWQSLSDTDKATILALGSRSINTHSLSLAAEPDHPVDTDTESTTAEESSTTPSDREVHTSAVSHTGPGASSTDGTKPVKDTHPGDPRRLLSPQNKVTRQAKTVQFEASSAAPGHLWDEAAYQRQLQAYWTTRSHGYDSDDGTTWHDAQDF